MPEASAVCTGFAIDHFLPQAAGGTDDYLNLYWSCEDCNDAKLDFIAADLALPNPVIMPIPVVRIDIDDQTDHFAVDNARSTLDEVWLHLLTPQAELHDDIFRVNSLVRRKMRAGWLRIWNYSDIARSGLRALRNMRIDQLRPSDRVKVTGIRERLGLKVDATDADFEAAIASQLAVDKYTTPPTDNERRKRLATLSAKGVVKHRDLERVKKK